MSSPPKPGAVRALRDKARLTQVEAAKLVHVHDRVWQSWESGKHRMPIASWELFQIKIEQLAEDRK